MNKIIKQHVPALELPQHLREGLDPSSLVTVVVEVEPHGPSKSELMALLEAARRSATGISEGEAVARVRELRDEWDD